MGLGKKLHRARHLGHKSLHKISMGSRAVAHGAHVGGRVLRVTGRLTGQPELVAAGSALDEAGDVAGKVGRVSRSLEKVV